MTFRTAHSVFAALGIAAFVAVLLPPDPAGASDYLIQEEPARGATVTEAPHQLVLTFDRPLAQISGAHHVEVIDSAGHRVDDGHADIATYSLRTLIVPIHAKSEGGLEVAYNVLLVQGDQRIRAESSYGFIVDHAFSPTGSEQIDAMAAEKSSQALVLWTIAILLGIAAAGGLLYFLRMATGNSRSSLEPINRSVFRD